MAGSLAIILAAGEGKRMRSSLPKVLHELRGIPLVLRPVLAARAAGVDRVVVVVGYGAELVQARIQERLGAQDQRPPWLRFVRQPQPLGTGHAVQCAMPEIDPGSQVLVLSGDVPGVRVATLDRMLEQDRWNPAKLTIVTFMPQATEGYGRVIRDAGGRVVAIREHRDATPQELEIRECNAGMYCFEGLWLRQEVASLGSGNAQGEFYLTDLIERGATQGQVRAICVPEHEVAGVNTPEQLAALEATWVPDDPSP